MTFSMTANVKCTAEQNRLLRNPADTFRGKMIVTCIIFVGTK